jgi:predicted 3-demethylubiquinone-9 3-methyltransferase (glyoxalase superfamily)
MPRVTPFLWFDRQAEEAAEFYTSIFKNSKITEVKRYGPAGPGPAGTVMTVAFELDGQPFIALNGGPLFTFTEAISFSIDCDTQHDVDELWEKLSADGETGQCGWLKDKYGLSWQVVPRGLRDLLDTGDPGKSTAATRAMLQMEKLDINRLREAYEEA